MPTYNKNIFQRIRTYFFTGLAVTAPIGITIYLSLIFINLIDDNVKNLVPIKYNPDTYLPFNIPGTGWELQEKNDPEAFARFLDENWPMGRLGLPEEVANVVVFISSPKSSSLQLIFIWVSPQSLEKTLTDEPVIVIEKNNNEKCDRCWHRNESVGSIPDHENLCSRCHQNIFDSGETRKLG